MPGSEAQEQRPVTPEAPAVERAPEVLPRQPETPEALAELAREAQTEIEQSERLAHEESVLAFEGVASRTGVTPEAAAGVARETSTDTARAEADTALGAAAKEARLGIAAAVETSVEVSERERPAPEVPLEIQAMFEKTEGERGEEMRREEEALEAQGTLEELREQFQKDFLGKSERFLTVRIGQAQEELEAQDSLIQTAEGPEKERLKRDRLVTNLRLESLQQEQERQNTLEGAQDDLQRLEGQIVEEEMKLQAMKTESPDAARLRILNTPELLEAAFESGDNPLKLEGVSSMRWGGL